MAGYLQLQGDAAQVMMFQDHLTNWKTIFLIWLATIITQAASGIEVINKLVTPGMKGSVESPGFPSCCSRDLNLTIIFQCQTAFSFQRGGFIFRFSDLDLPPDAGAGIFTQHASGDLQHSGFLSYNKRRKTWNPSYHVVNDCHVAIGFIIKKSSSNQIYTGFKLHYEYYSRYDRPMFHGFYYTSGDNGGTLKALTGGQIFTETPTRSSVSKVRFSVWQIKPQAGYQQTPIKTFLRVNQLFLKGSLEIRKGLTSESPLLFEYSSDSRYLTSIEAQPSEGFTSAEGFYIALHLNLTVEGRFGFVFGDFQQSTLISAIDNSCDFDVRFVPGFFCLKSDWWCIPRSFLCDGIQHCPANEDEQLPECFTTTTSTTTTTTTTARPTTTKGPSLTRRPVRPSWVWETPTSWPYYTTTSVNDLTNGVHEYSTAAKVKYIGAGIAFFLICLSLYLGYRLKMRKRRPGGGLTSDLCPTISGGMNGRSGPSSSHPYSGVATNSGFELRNHPRRPGNPITNGEAAHRPRAPRLLPNRPNIYNPPPREGPPSPPPGPMRSPEPRDLQQPPPSYSSVVEPSPSEPPPAFNNLELPPSYDQVMAETENNLNLNRTTYV